MKIGEKEVETCMPKKPTLTGGIDRLEARVDARLAKQFRHAIIDQDLSVQEGVERALQLFLAGAALPQFLGKEAWEGLEPADQALIAAMPQFLREAHGADAVRAIVRSWIDFRATAERGPGKPGRPE